MSGRHLLASLLAAAALAQTPAAGPPSVSLTGVVKEATTRVPLEGVRVWAGQSDATTGPQGQFTFQKLEPGRHWVSVEDLDRAASGGVFVLLNPGRDVTGVEILLNSGGSISGKVLDEDRKPISGARVSLLEPVFEFGQLAYRSKLSEKTGANGEYRLAPVPSGRGFLLLAARPIELGPRDQRSASPVFYPASPDILGGETVTLAPGEERRAVDFRMAFAPAFCIAGQVDSSGGAAAGEVTITRQLPHLFGSWTLSLTIPAADGKFSGCGFPPGDYRVGASGFASAEAAIVDADLDDLRLVPASAIALSGDAVFDPPPRGDTPEARIGADLRKVRDKHVEETQSGSIRTSFSYGGRIRVPGSFSLQRLPADDYAVDLRDLPEGCYVKEATLAGADILHAPLRLSEALDSRLRIALACDAGSLQARVTDREGNPVSDVNVFVIPGDAGSAAALSMVVRQAAVENGWSGTVKPLPPGKYLVLAAHLDFDGSAEPFLKLWRWRSHAKEVEIGTNQSTRVMIELADLN